MKNIVLLLLSISFFGLNAQDVEYSMHDFILNGSATVRDDTTFMLTDNLLQQTGSIWYKDDIDLREPFHIELDLFFGCSDGGADGITFLLHPELAMGSDGEGMAVGGLTPSFGVEMDTYQNFHLKDAHFDHAAIMANGMSNHKLGLTEPIPLHPDKKNVENCTFYTAIFKWNPDSQIFTYIFNGIERIRRKIDLVSLIFKDNFDVFWGLGAATGLKRNKQLVRIRRLQFTPNESLSVYDQASLLHGGTYIFEDIRFEEGSAVLPEAAKPILDKLMLFHQEYQNYTFILDGFTGTTVNTENISLAKDRAEAMARHMISRGFTRDKIIFFGNRKSHASDVQIAGEEQEKKSRIELRMKILKV